jgi:UDP-N-acetylmuramoyl-L-alanyl-D-glutamate--2,6-diaminopimelate ligase
LNEKRIDELIGAEQLLAPLGAAVADLPVRRVRYDSRRVEPGDLFFAFRGANSDGRDYCAAARAKGAVAVVSEMPELEGFEGPWIQVKHGRKALALAGRALHGDPSAGKVALFGVTGTNGKTTTSYLLGAILEAAGHQTGVFGTIEHRIGARRIESINTTPESCDLYEYLEGLTAAALEVSSHALDLGRVWGMHFRAAIWTNLTRDHLDFHGDMESYFRAKCELFRGQDAAPPEVAAINADDAYGAKIPLAAETKAWTYGLEGKGDVRAEKLAAGFEGLRFEAVTPLGRFGVESKMLGRVNVYNILGAITAALAAGVSVADVQAGVLACSSVPGRFERVDAGQPFLVVVDYAHTDDALRNLIRAARALQPRRVITLFGCGGDRDRAKRPMMAAAAAEASDYVVLTSDNPRTEDPLAIMNDALVGLRRFDTPHSLEPDRKKAIALAIAKAEAGDIVLLAGKGHETYQVIGKEKQPFDDRLVARHELARVGYAKGAAQ